MELFDTHFHIDDINIKDFISELPTDIKFLFMAVSGDLSSAVKVRNFAEELNNCWFACGVHPHEADAANGDFSGFAEFKRHPKLKAVGEIGLDYFYDLSDRKSQARKTRQESTAKQAGGKKNSASKSETESSRHRQCRQC